MFCKFFKKDLLIFLNDDKENNKSKQLLDFRLRIISLQEIV